MRKHLKARFPFLNGKRINEGISTDRLYANCPDLKSGFTSAHVFYGMHSSCINVYGHHAEGDGFYNCYQDFCREHGFPSTLRRDNATESKSKKVLDFNRQYIIQDQWSEVDNQQQNLVESGGIRWLKSAVHVLQDMTGAPPWTWYLAALYLADIHNHTWNKEQGFIPITARDGITRDISRLLQFVFWERILYLDHQGSFPDSKERLGYFVGCSSHVGDELTYLIYDDQSKQIVSRSVVRPYTTNKQVRWDPAIDASPAPKSHTACDNTKFHLAPTIDMDSYDEDEPEPSPHFWDTAPTHPDQFLSLLLFV